MESEDIGGNAVCDSLGCIVDRVARQMGVARRGLYVAVTEQLADTEGDSAMTACLRRTGKARQRGFRFGEW